MSEGRETIVEVPQGWERVACHLCGSADDSLFVYDHDINHAAIRMVICQRCGLLYQDPTMTSEALADYYRDGYWNTVGFGDRPTRRNLLASLDVGREIARQCAPHMVAQGWVLDVGSARGGMLRAFIEQGHRATGVEPSDLWAGFTRDVLGLDVRHATLEQADLTEGSFDLATLSHVLEHLPDPAGSLRRLRQLLTPSGLLCVEVPDVTFPATSPRKRFHIGHLMVFSAATLEAMVTRSGFDIVARLHRNGYLRLLARKAPGEAPRDGALPEGEADRIRGLLARMDPWHCYTGRKYWGQRMSKVVRNLSHRCDGSQWRARYGLPSDSPCPYPDL